MIPARLPPSSLAFIADEFQPANYSEAKFRKAVAKIEKYLFSLPQLDVVLHHTFADGVYIREMELPAGSTVTSRVHKKDHVVFLLRGSCLITDQRGCYTLHGPKYFFTPKGTKRVIVALTDLSWANSVAVKATTPEEALEEMSCVTWAEWDRECGLIPRQPRR